MNVSISSVKDSIAKIVEKASGVVSHKEPDLAVLEQFDSNAWKAIYLGMFYVSKNFSRIVTLWILFSWISNLL
jgi:hypothetical protein